MFVKRSLTLAMAIAVAGTTGVGTVAGAETELTSMTSLPRNLQLTLSYREHFIPRVNKAGKGVVRIKYLGGPEITPPRKAAAALKRGMFDVLHSPTAYYIGMVPEGYALTISQKTPAELRANGGFDLLKKAYAEKAGAQLLAWGEAGTQYNTYLATEPKFEANGNLSLKGIKMRVTGTYRPLFQALGATTIGIKHTEIYTGIKRGVVQGFGWPDVGITALGLHKVVKYRIDPPFYRSNNAVTVNMAKWNTLSRKAKDILERAGLEYEQAAIGYMEDHRAKEEKILLASGMKLIKLKGANAKHYLDAANSAVWAALQKRSKYADALKAKSFPDM